MKQKKWKQYLDLRDKLPLVYSRDEEQFLKLLSEGTLELGKWVQI